LVLRHSFDIRHSCFVIPPATNHRPREIDKESAMSTVAEYTAKHRFARISVRKLRPILDLVRGKYADDAVDILKYMPHRGARMIEQVLKSAMANAEDRGIRNVGDLVVIDARGDGGPMFKRLMPRARGMAYMIRRRSAHIEIGLADMAAVSDGDQDQD
jgi:large subunit ribosomal protein L22